MTRDEVKKIIEKSGRALGLPEKAVTLEHPENSEHGDFSTNIAMQCAKETKRAPLDIAVELARELKKEGGYLFGKIETAQPGFINFFISKNRWIQEVKEIHAYGGQFGLNSFGKGKKARIEFISANLPRGICFCKK